jgi:hypothetical protein
MSQLESSLTGFSQNRQLPVPTAANLGPVRMGGTARGTVYYCRLMTDQFVNVDQ